MWAWIKAVFKKKNTKDNNEHGKGNRKQTVTLSQMVVLFLQFSLWIQLLHNNRNKCECTHFIKAPWSCKLLVYRVKTLMVNLIGTKLIPLIKCSASKQNLDLVKKWKWRVYKMCTFKRETSKVIKYLTQIFLVMLSTTSPCHQVYEYNILRTRCCRIFKLMPLVHLLKSLTCSNVGHVFWKSYEHDKSRKMSPRIFKFIPYEFQSQNHLWISLWKSPSIIK